MKAKEIKILGSKDDRDIIVEYIYKKQLNIHTSCCICPKDCIKIGKHLEKIISHKDDFIIAVYSNTEITGVGCFINEPSNKYLESIGLFINEDNDFETIINYLKTNYSGNRIDFVFPPENARVLNLLKTYNAKFDTIQICHEITFDNFVVKYNNCKILELNEEYFESYRKIHNDKEVYWTADRIINSPQLFRTFLAINNNEVIGYIDITYRNELNEIYDLYVIKEYTDEYIEALLNESIVRVLNENNRIILLLNIDDVNNIKILKKMGFKEKDKSQTIILYI